MAFVLKTDRKVRWPVSLELPADGGKYEKQTFDAVFAQLPQDRVTAILVDAQRLKIAVETNQDLEGMLHDVEVAKEVLVGWAGILDDTGKEVPFSEGMRDELLQIPSVASTVCAAWVECVQKGKRGN